MSIHKLNEEYLSRAGQLIGSECNMNEIPCRCTQNAWVKIYMYLIISERYN